MMHPNRKQVQQLTRGFMIADKNPFFVETQDTISQYGPHSITRNILEDKDENIWLATHPILFLILKV